MGSFNERVINENVQAKLNWQTHFNNNYSITNCNNSCLKRM